MLSFQVSDLCVYIIPQGINQLMYKKWLIVMRTSTKEREQWREYLEQSSKLTGCVHRLSNLYFLVVVVVKQF